MGAIAAIRGLTFQAAVTIHVALDLLESDAFETLQVEGDVDAVDYTVERQGTVSRLGQVRSRRQPGVWQPAELAEIIKGLLRADARRARLEFVTDATLGRAAWDLNQAIARRGRGETSAADVALLTRYGLLSLGDEALGRVELSLRPHRDAP